MPKNIKLDLNESNSIDYIFKNIKSNKSIFKINNTTIENKNISNEINDQNNYNLTENNIIINDKNNEKKNLKEILANKKDKKHISLNKKEKKKRNELNIKLFNSLKNNFIRIKLYNI